MTQKPHPIQAYTRATHTVAKTRQVVMLYDGMIRFLNQAADAMEKGAIEERYTKLCRASDVITGLQGALDFEAGGHTAQVLYDFYGSVEMRIMELHRHPNAASCRQIVAELKEMRDVWDGIDRGADARASAATPPAPDDVPPTSPSSVKVSA